MSAPDGRRPRRVEAGAVTVSVRRKRVPSGLSRAELVLGGTFAVLQAIPVAAIFYTFAYAV